MKNPPAREGLCTSCLMERPEGFKPPTHRCDSVALFRLSYGRSYRPATRKVAGRIARGNSGLIWSPEQ